jgi:hypothetical protein
MPTARTHRTIKFPPRDYLDALRGRLSTATDEEKARLRADIDERYDKKYAWDVEQRRKPVDGPAASCQYVCAN